MSGYYLIMIMSIILPTAFSAWKTEREVMFNQKKIKDIEEKLWNIEDSIERLTRSVANL